MFYISKEYKLNEKSLKHNQFFEIPDILIYNYLKYICFALIMDCGNLMDNDGYYSFITVDDSIWRKYNIQVRSFIKKRMEILERFRQFSHFMFINSILKKLLIIHS